MGAAIAKTLVFQPPSPVIPCDQIVNSSVDSSHVWLETRRGSRIEAFFVDRRAQMTVLFSHANAEDVSMDFAWLRELSLRLGVNVLGYSYTGYARSSKPPSELDVYADVDAAWDYLMARKVDARRVVLYSRSVGSGPTLYLAERLSAAGTPPWAARAAACRWTDAVMLLVKIPLPGGADRPRKPLIHQQRLSADSTSTRPTRILV